VHFSVTSVTSVTGDISTSHGGQQVTLVTLECWHILPPVTLTVVTVNPRADFYRDAGDAEMQANSAACSR
jgi:hypothetical protein